MENFFHIEFYYGIFELNFPDQMLKAYKYRLYPNKAQAELMHKHFGCSRFVYNLALECKDTLYKDYGKSVSISNIAKEIRWLKNNDPNFFFLKEVSSSITEKRKGNALGNLDQAYTNFFNDLKKPLKERHFDYPRKKSKFSRQSFYVRARLGIGKPRLKVNFEKKRLFWSKAFGEVKFDAHRRFYGEIRDACTVSKDTDGKYYISILVDDMLVQPEQKPIEKNKTIGLDLGVKLLYADNKGNHVEGLNEILKPLELKKAKLQRRLSKKIGSKKGEAKSNRWIKLSNQIKKVDTKIVRIREYYLHNKTRELIDREDVNAYIVEDLKIKNMTASAKGNEENHGKNVAAKSGLNRAIMRQGLRKFRTQLEYKAAWRGKQVIAVDPKYTSRTCPSCGHKSKDNRKKQAIFECVECGHIDNADVNAAKNIKNRFFKAL